MEPIVLDDGLAMRPAMPADAEALVRLVDEARRQADPLMPWWTEQPTDADARAWARRHSDAHPRWLVIARGELIGSVGIAAGAAPAEGTLGCWLSPHADDFATRERACEAAIEHAFGAAGYERLRFVCGEDDEQSVALARQLGFTVERREHEPALYVSGGYRTVLTWVLARPDWRSRAGGGG